MAHPQQVPDHEDFDLLEDVDVDSEVDDGAVEVDDDAVEDDALNVANDVEDDGEEDVVDV